MHSAPPSWPGTVAAVPRSLKGHSEAAAVRAPVTGPFFAVRELSRDPNGPPPSDFDNPFVSRITHDRPIASPHRE